MEVKVCVLHPRDNVATALADIAQGETVQTADARVVAAEPIAFGHKIALARIGRGQQVTKYGESIGVAAADIAPGGLVHVHNLESLRGRGDLDARKTDKEKRP
ncbi:MAG TPA: UxaA family hydrolase [Ramlibacter sp.]|uniref:UxaA family hydrolase n=1 Tax=Ramlibacter sp. TaxID=1917967 RepID=UPI002C53F7DE|nr:UxaA family hydrolase [Ramlibacter sp.]HVZ46809.1 UxaA family hydrolase [Ramlibacter sp.]